MLVLFLLAWVTRAHLRANEMEKSGASIETSFPDSRKSIITSAKVSNLLQETPEKNGTAPVHSGSNGTSRGARRARDGENVNANWTS